MELMRVTWPDSRLDDLNARVGTLGDELREVRKEIRELRVEVGGEMREVRKEMAGLRDDFLALQRTLIQIGGGLIGTLLVGMLGLVATQL